MGRTVSVPRISLLGVGIDAFTAESLNQELGERIDRRERALVLNVNAHCFVLTHRHAWLRRLLNSADLVFCDGAGVVLGAAILGRRLPGRITYADWMWQLAAYAEARGYSFYLLGGADGVAAEAAESLRRRHPKLQVVGSRNGFFDKSPGGAQDEQVIAEINEARPDFLIVAFGMPLQEQWLAERWQRLDVRVGLTGGAALDYVSGRQRRAPRLLTDHGFEWLGRLLLEPKRLWKRYLVGNPHFLWLVLLERLGLLPYARPSGSPQAAGSAPIGQ